MKKISTLFSFLWFLIGLWVWSIPVAAQAPQVPQASQSQQPLTKRDADNITFFARQKMKDLNNLLNQLTFDDLAPAERDEMIKNSFDPASKQRIFYNSSAIVEDDVNPNHTSGDNVQDAPIEKYLTDLYLLYTKVSEPNTIVFSDQVFSPVKQTGNSIYIQVNFTSVFKGKHNQITKEYQPNTRTVEMQAEKVDKKWVVYITRIAFARSSGSNSLVTGNTPAKKLNSGKPTIPANLSISGPEVVFIQTDDKYKVITKFNSYWLQVVQAEKPEVPVGFYKRINKSYVYDSLTNITFANNNKRFVLHKGTDFTVFDQPVNPAKPVATPTLANTNAPKPPKDTTQLASRPPQKETKPTLAKPPVSPTKPQAKPDTISSSIVVVNKPGSTTTAKPTQEPAKPPQALTEPQATITMIQAKKTGKRSGSDSVQRSTVPTPDLRVSKPAHLPSNLSGLMSIARKDSLLIGGEESASKPETKPTEPIVTAPKPEPVAPALAKALDADAKKQKARYRTMGWLQIVAGVAGLAGSYMAYSSIKKDYDGYKAQVDKLNTEYAIWQEMSRQPNGGPMTPMSITGYGKPGIYGAYAGGAVSLGLVINGIRSLGKAGKIKLKSEKK